MIRHVAFVIAVALAPGLAGTAARAQQIPETVSSDALRVCADPANMPFSNRKGEGFENRIAAIIAGELKLPLRNYWLPQGPGFVRNSLQSNLCDLIVGYAAGAGPVQHSNPYYRSVYVLVVRKGGDLDGVTRLDDPRLRHRRLGIVAATPPVDYLNAQGLLADAKSYPLLVDRRFESPGEAMIADLAAGTIDGALLWGPIGGYYAAKAGVALTVVPLIKDVDGPALSYRITFGIRPAEQNWKHRLNDIIRRRQADIDRVLADYGVPLLDEDNSILAAAGGGAEPPR